MARILFASASPASSGAQPVGDDREFRAIKQAIRDVGCLDDGLVSELACGIDDLRNALIRHAPALLHVAAHGSPAGLLLENGSGGGHELSARGLVELVAASDHTRKVVLNVCWSDALAEKLLRVDHVECVIGMSKEVDRDSAIKFAAGFHASLARGDSIAKACKFGRAAISSNSLPDESVPMIRCREGVDPGTLTLPSSRASRDDAAATQPDRVIDVPHGTYIERVGALTVRQGIVQEMRGSPGGVQQIVGGDVKGPMTGRGTGP